MRSTVNRVRAKNPRVPNRPSVNSSRILQSYLLGSFLPSEAIPNSIFLRSYRSYQNPTNQRRLRPWRAAAATWARPPPPSPGTTSWSACANPPRPILSNPSKGLFLAYTLFPTSFASLLKVITVDRNWFWMLHCARIPVD